MKIDAALALQLDSQLEDDLKRDGRLGKPKRYLEGDHDLPYMPKGAKAEFEHMAKRAITNWTPLLSDTFGKLLFVDGYRAARASDNAPAWAYWQDNGLDARQTVAHRGALEYGTSYVLVLPGKDKARPVIRPLSPLVSMAWYATEDDEFPELALHRLGTRVDGSRSIAIYDATNVYTFAMGKDGGDWRLESTVSHGLGVTPFVRFRDRLDDVARGIITPAITIQDRINEVVFALLIAMQYASFRQRWATGLVVPIDEDEGTEENPNPNYGQPIEPFESAVNRLWVSDSPDTKFGDFAQTEISGHLALYDASVKTLAGIAQISPNILTGDLINLAAEALAQLNDTTQRKSDEYAALFGESWESVFRLASLAAGETDAAQDRANEVRWRDTEARSLAQTVDALGKLAQMLGVPVEALWEKVPGVTESEVQRWKGMRAEDPLNAIAAEFSRQTAVDAAAEPAAATAAPASDIKAKADALGALIRSGVSPETAAAQVGLDGVEFTGAVPVSLRLPEQEAADLETA